MLKSSRLILAPLILLFILAGCGTYSKILKSNDRDLMYRTALDYYKAGKYQRTTQLLEEVAPSYAGTYREDTLKYYLGAAYYKMSDFETSGFIFDDFRRRFGRSPFVEDAEYMLAMGYYFSSPPVERDQTTTRQGISAINEFLYRYPNTVKRDLLKEREQELQHKLYEQEFLNAKTYYKIGRYKSAIVAFKNALIKSPETPFREEILFLITKSGYEYASRSVPWNQRDRYLDMMDSYYTFIAEYPDSRFASEAAKMQESAKKYLARQPDGTEEQEPEIKSNPIF